VTGPSTALGDFCRISGGGKLGLTGADFVEDGVPAFGAGGINGYVKKVEFRRPGVVLSSIGARCGKCFFADGEWTTLANTQVILPDTTVCDPRFLWYQLNDELSWHRSGTAQPFIKPADVRGRRVYLPPIEEQRRTAEILGRADALRTKRREALAHLDALTQSIFLDMFGDPLTSSTKWPGSPLGNIAETSSGGTPSRAVRHYFGGSIPWVKSGELDEDVVLSTSECLTPAGLQHSSAKLLDAGPVLIAMYGATVGSVSRLGIRAATNQAVCAVRVGLRVRPDYLIAFLRRMTPQLLASRAGGAQPNLSQGQIQRLIIGVPPLALQDSFVEAVGRVARLRISGRCSLDYTDALSASLQQRAFAGQL